MALQPALAHPEGQVEQPEVVDAPEPDCENDAELSEDDEIPRPKKVSQRKRADNAAFDLWVEENQEQLAGTTAVKQVDKSVVSLVRDFESGKIITNPREYQLELFERAKLENTIAVLDTGSGKTLIAALLLRWTVEQELERRAQGEPSRVALFLVDKVALVFQQHGVLECNLDHPIGKLCGEMTDSSWKRLEWRKFFDANMVVVCTAAILNDCLHRGFILMEEISLLIFDEAHHTKKNHPYARIIKDFYALNEDHGPRPRIFGMTASPVDAQTNVHKAAAELEGLLQSRIVTVADPTALQQTVCKPKIERTIEYTRLRCPFKTALHSELWSLVGEHAMFRKAFAFSHAATSHLGPWCADRLWKVFLDTKELVEVEAKSERNYRRQFGPQVHRLDQYMDEVRTAREVVSKYSFDELQRTDEFLSSKVITLVNLLHDRLESPEGEGTRCIVFVQQRQTAKILKDLLDQPAVAIPGLRTGVLIGTGYSETDHVRLSLKEQLITILKFKQGELNCLFATSIAEEGLDIPDCNLIIRFDLYNTMIQYIQSRGRARQDNSTYIHMIEQGNGEQRRKVLQNASNEFLLRQFCTTLPEDRKLGGNDFGMEYFLRKERRQRQYTVPSSGAKLTYKESLVVLASFTASLPHPPEVDLSPVYSTIAMPGGFLGEVIMPPESPISSATGNLQKSKQAAKCSAAYSMCLELLKGKYLDEHLKSTFDKNLPSMRNARLAISSKKREQYRMVAKPKLWSQLGHPDQLYCSVLRLSHPEAMNQPSRPLLLLTREPLPHVGPFSLYFGKARASAVQCIGLGKPMDVAMEEAKVLALTTFTLLVFKHVFSKEYEAGPRDLPYFLAPANAAHNFDFNQVEDPRSIVDWDTTQRVQTQHDVKWSGEEPDDFFSNKFVWDPANGARKFVILQRRHEMKPLDPVPDGIAAPSHRSWREMEHNIMNYSSSLWAAARSRAHYREDQPVVEARLVSLRRNLLDDTIGDEVAQNDKCFLILEPLRISPLPMDVVAMVYNLPAIIYRIESNMIALDGCKALGLEVRPDLALEAFTKDSDNSEDHGTEQINFQPGMGNNYERLEFLGDTFLKMATTISIFTCIPDKGEFEYHVERMLLICNKNLFNNALEINLQEYIRSSQFSRRDWYPEGLKLVRGKKSGPKDRHVLADKSIADVCEAVIGAAYLTAGGLDGDLDLPVRAVTTMVKNKNHAMSRFAEYFAEFVAPDWQAGAATSTQLALAAQIEAKMGYNFRHPRLLRSAFQHPSYPRSYENIASYQRLEFLGDALLDMVCVDYLFRRFPGADPQWLTEHKMAMVSNNFLGCLAVSLGFHKHMMSFHGQLQRQVHDYVSEVNLALEQAKEAAVAEGKHESAYRRNYWAEASQPPKCLADLVEAYIGAIFVDSEYDYGVVRSFFATHVRPFFTDMALYDTFANKHPVTFLASRMQLVFRCTDWRLVVHEMAAEDGTKIFGGDKVAVGVMIHRKVFAHAVSASGRYAKIAAAKKAMAMLEDLTLEKFREMFGCECVVHSGDGPSQRENEVDAELLAAAHGSAI